jgi:hypothetical protein
MLEYARSFFVGACGDHDTDATALRPGEVHERAAGAEDDLLGVGGRRTRKSTRSDVGVNAER